MSEPRSIRDPIHGFIRLNEKEADIIDTRAFQRLRNLRQLAFAYLVYPGAVHTRFEHSLGVCHVAGQLAKKLEFNDDEARLVRLAALMHDMGHGPFSHVSEEALEIFSDYTKLPANTDKIHELITGTLIRGDRQVSKVLSSSETEQIISLLDRGYGEPIVRNILSGPLDADKQDYLLRDTYFCGVKYGIFDLAQFHQVLESVSDPAGGKLLMVNPEGIHTLEQFVLAKYYMTTQVIKHRIRLITDQMLLRAICLAIEKDEIDELKALYSFDGSYAFVERYSQWDDTNLLQRFSDQIFEGKYGHVLFSGLRHRSLLKLVFRSRVSELKVGARDTIKSISKRQNKARRRQLEELLGECIQKIHGLTAYAGLDSSEFVIVHSYTFKSVKEESRNNEGSVLINKPTPLFFEDASTLFQSIDEKLSETFVEVYAPVSYATPADRRRLQTRLRTPIVDTLEQFCVEGEL